MHKLQSVKLPKGPAHDKVVALVVAIRSAKICLKEVGAESQLFADCNTIGKPVSKLDKCTQDIWFH